MVLHAPDVDAPYDHDRSRHSRSELGQALVETAALLPLLLILLVGAIDLGRVFFGYVNLHQAARTAANYAATHPQDNYANSGITYYTLIEREAAGINCDLEAAPVPTFSSANPGLGDSATVQLRCSFDLITPIAAQLVGGGITMSAESTFPVREGCVGCPPPPTASPPPEPESLCRVIPPMVNLSLDGARHAWLSAGFLPANFTAPSAVAGTSTVTDSPSPEVEDIPESGCDPGQAHYSSTVEVWVRSPDPTDPTCRTVPNLTGLPVKDARDSWTASGFTGEFSPPEPDDDPLGVVMEQTTTPTSEAGVTCLPPDTTVEVEVGDPWAVPPPPPCIVPSFTEGVRRNDAQALWTGAHFQTQVSLVGGNGNWLIKGQSLVGGEPYHCSVRITLYEVQQTP